MLKTSTNFLKKDLNSPHAIHTRSPKFRNSNDLDKSSSKFGVVVKSLDKKKKIVKRNFGKIADQESSPVTHLDEDLVSPKYSRNSIEGWRENSPLK